MAQKVAKVGVKKARGWLYFVDKQGDISRAKMARGGRKKKKKATKRKPASRKKPAKRKKPASRKKPARRKPARRKKKR